MEKEEIAPGVIRVNNFLSKKENDYLLNFLKNSKEDLWYNSNKEDFWNGKLNQNFKNTKMCINILYRIKNEFPECTVSFLNAQRFKDGEKMGDHLDNAPGRNIKYGLVIHLNDNFYGGEIVYKDLGISLKPKPCSMIYHDAELLHYVNEIKGNTRYFLTSFVHYK
jgi:hypothetical protein